jgi:hypothetical protein
MSCLKATAATAWILLAACENNAIDPLSGKYPEPENHALEAVLSLQTGKGESLRTFRLELGGAGQSLSIEFIGNRMNYFLAPGAYTPAGRNEAKAGNYVSGDAEGGTWWTTPDARRKLVDGTVFVELDGETYTIRGVVALEDRSMIRISYTGVIAFEADPPSFAYSVEVTKPYAWTADGTTYIPVEGTQLNKISVSSEGQSFAYFEIVTEADPPSLTGTYPVKAVNSLERAIVQGQYLDLAWFGVPFDMVVESGSYYIDGESKMFIREGNIRITDNDGTLSISGDGLAIQDVASQAAFGNLPAPGSLTITDAAPDGGGGGTDFSNLYAASALDLSLFGLEGYTVTLKIATPGLDVQVEQGAMGAAYAYAGSGQYVSFDFKRDAASLPEGMYNIVSNESAALNDCIAGYPSLFGAGFMGAFVGVVANGEAREEAVTGGWVEVLANGIRFSLTTGSGTLQGSYAGAIAWQ